jgi:hypothetical protein
MDASTLVLEIISAANLSPTEHLLLKHFIEAAVDPELAVNFLNRNSRRSAMWNQRYAHSRKTADASCSKAEPPRA